MHNLWITGSFCNGKRAEPAFYPVPRGVQGGDRSSIPPCPQTTESRSLPSDLPLGDHNEKTVSSERMERKKRMEILTDGFFFFILYKCVVLSRFHNAKGLS